jgi:hypothetical protein
MSKRKNVVEVDASVLAALTQQIQSMALELKETKEVVAESKCLNLKLQKLQLKVDSRNKLNSAGFDWRHKGNKLQFEYNISVVNTLVEASTAAEYDDQEEAKRLLNEGIKNIFARNKLIKLVDHSESGWGFALEYLDADLAENEEDSKKIKRAEAAAAAKRKRTYYSSRSSGSDSRDSRDSRDYYNRRQRESTPYSRRHDYDRSGSDRNEKGSKLGPCYFCQGDHLRSTCEAYKEHLKKQVARNNGS